MNIHAICIYISFCVSVKQLKGSCGRDCMLVGFTTNYVISA